MLYGFGKRFFRFAAEMLLKEGAQAGERSEPRIAGRSTGNGRAIGLGRRPAGCIFRVKMHLSY